MDLDKVDHAKVAALVDTRRRERDMTMSQLAQESGLSLASIHRFLRGYGPLRSASLRRILDALEISSDELTLTNEPAVHSKGKHIFISYSHRDKDYLDRLMIHLKPLQRKGLIDPWVDSRLLAGDRWKKEIENALKNARAAILLISADFLASDFILDNELPPLLHAAEEKGTLIIPVILTPCRFTREKSLVEFQAINPPDEPLSLVDDSEREVIYDAIAQRVETSFDKNG